MLALILKLVPFILVILFLIWKFKYFVKQVYFFWYRLEPQLVNEAKVLFRKKRFFSKRKTEINSVRANNIIVTFWSHAGTVAALFVTLFAAFYALFISYEEYFHWFDFSNQPYFGVLVKSIPLICAYVLLVLITPVLLRRIVDHLPSDSYANLSLGNLNPSEVITYLAYKNWQLCHAFVQQATILKNSKVHQWHDLIKTDVNEDDHNAYEAWKKEFDKVLKKPNQGENEARKMWVEEFENLRIKTLKFRADRHRDIENLKALKVETTRKLNILPIELCHHILQFSPSIFEVRLDNYIGCIETLQYILKNDTFEDESKFVFTEVMREMYRIQEDISERRMRNLFQVIVFKNIHNYIVGLASATSTSQSLKIFARGLSSILESDSSDYDRSNAMVFQEFKALLHRSKAHYGFDLLISLENFYKQYYEDDAKRKKIPGLLNDIKYLKGKYQKETEKEGQINPSPLFLANEDIRLLKDIREDIVKKYKGAMKKINTRFVNELNDLISRHQVERNIDDPNIYILIFGYSRIVKNTLLSNSKMLQDKKIKIFVMKEADSEMLDTRMLRFELNDRKEEDQKVKYSFTATDSFFRSLLQKDDLLIMAAGIEALDKERSLLFHTNKYQERVENLFRYLAENEGKKPHPYVFAFGGKYKIYNEFPDFKLSKESVRKESFADHYDKVDLYNFKDYGIQLNLISDLDE